MIVRIRLGQGARVGRTGRKNRHVALAFAALLMPASLMAAVLACWRLAADLKWTSQFAIASGPFSHWQVWIACAAALLLVAQRLNRYGQDEPDYTSMTAPAAAAAARMASTDLR